MQDPEYILIRDIGPPHARIFTIRCKVSSFEEDGTATTKKQAKHDAAKKMVDKIRALMTSSNDHNYHKEKDKGDSSNSSITTIDTELMNKNAEEYYRTLKMTRKVNLGIKLAEYHVNWKDSLETEKRDKILEQLEYLFPDEFFNEEFIIDGSITEKVSKLKTVLSDVDVTINIKDIPTQDDDCVMMAIELNTCPLLVQIGMGRDNVEATWKALSQVIKSIKLLLS